MSNKTMLGDASGRGAVDGFRVTCPAMQHPCPRQSSLCDASSPKGEP